MKHFVLLLALAAPAAFAAPAQAADLATIGCIASRIELPVRAQVAIDVERNLNSPGAPATYDPRVTAALNLAGKICADQNGWSEAALKPAMLYALASLGWPTAQKIATERGFDMGALEDAWAAVPEEKRNHPLVQTDYQELIRGFITDEALQTRENAELVKQCFGFLSVIQYSSYAFSQA
ncbi:MAG: hypothetical protein ACAH11_07095 [Sphingomonas sp.]